MKEFSISTEALAVLSLAKADGLKPPLWTSIWYEHPRKRGQAFQDSEIVAVWKRGRFVWVDPLFKRRERR